MAEAKRGERGNRTRWRNRHCLDHHPGRGGGGDAGEKEEEAGEELEMHVAVAAAGADTGAGVNRVAPYSALLAEGATATVAPNDGGLGWYEVASAGARPPGHGHLGTEEGRGCGGGGGGGGRFRKNDLLQALGMIASNRVVLVRFAASSVRMIATWATAVYMVVRSKVLPLARVSGGTFPRSLRGGYCSVLRNS